MPQYIHLGSMINTIIESTLSNDGYVGPEIPVKYNIDWHGKYQLWIFNHRYREIEEDKKYHGIMVPNYLSPNEPILLYTDPYRITYKTSKVTRLIVHNLRGWNDDPRCRGTHYDDPGFDPEIIKKEWYDNYTDIVKIEKEITLDDIANSIFTVKSGKLDDTYEMFIRANCKYTNITDTEIELYINLEFDHGS